MNYDHPSHRSKRPRRWLLAASASFASLLALGWSFRQEWFEPPNDGPTIQALIQRGNKDEASRRLDRRLRRNPEDSAAWLILGGLRGLQRRDDEALSAFAHVKSPDAARAQARSLMGEIQFQRRNAAGAEEALMEAARSDPAALGARLRLVYLFEVERREDEARAVLWDLYRMTGDARHLITLVGTTLEGPDARDPKPELKEFLEKSPSDPILHRAWGLTLLAEGKPSEALPELEAASPALEDDALGRLALAECRIARGDADGGERTLGSEPVNTSIQGRYWYLRGKAEDVRGKVEHALDAWQRATELDPNQREAHYQLGQSLLRLGRVNRAKPYLERAEAIRVRGVSLIRELDRCLREGRDADTFSKVARLCEESGLEAEARAWYGEVIRLDPTRSEAQSMLAHQPRPRTALTVLRRKAAVATIPTEQGSVATKPVVRGFRFEDIASRAGLNYAYQCGASAKTTLPDTMGGGVGLIDYDADGRLDIYFVNGCPLPLGSGELPSPNRLFRNLGDGTFEDVTQKAGVGGRGYGMGCVVGDYDNDGHDDLFVTGLGHTVLYRNRGDGTFEDRTLQAGVGSSRWTTAAGFGDLDGDGDLDLVVVTYVEVDPKREPDCRDPLGRPMHCPPGQFQPQFDHLFRNNGDGTFTDVGREAGFELSGGLGLGLAIADLDGDDKLDIFVANDAAPNFFFRNLGALNFEEVGVSSGLAYDGTGRATASMGVVADDLDGDGLIDIFHTNFLNEPNTFHKNIGRGFFDDRSSASGLDAPSRPVTGFGTNALDVDNDGFLDLFVANGHVDDRPLAGHPMAQLPHLYRATSPGRFLLSPPTISQYFARPVVGRGSAAGDLDGDGRVDLVIVHRDQPASLLRNVTEGGHSLGLKLVGKRLKTPVGARVTCHANGRIAVRWLTSGTSYLAASDSRLFFGLGDAQSVSRLEVRWPSGLTQVWENLSGDRLLELQEGNEFVHYPSRR